MKMTMPTRMATTKTITFAVMHFSIAFMVTYLLTGSAVIGGAVATIEPAVNTVAYYFHEKFWQHRNAARQTPLGASFRA